MTTEAEQNRLIIENAGLATVIAADFRGVKGIPFDELRGQAMLELVLAARMCTSAPTFPKYAKERIRGGLKNYISSWQEFVPFEDAGLADEGEERFYEWSCWQNAAPYETWDGLEASPEELRAGFEELSNRQEALSAAMGFLKPRVRKMLYARFFREPNQTLESIAKEHKISYARTVELISKALKKLREDVIAYEKNKNKRHEGNVIAFPARAGSWNRSDRPNNLGRKIAE